MTSDRSSESGTKGRLVEISTPYRPRFWDIAFVQDCNLRCAYCCTGYGCRGGPRKVMDEQTANRLIELLDAMSEGNDSISIQFGTGETFLHFDRAMAVIDRLHERLNKRNSRVRVLITTNGTLADEAKLQACLDRRVSLAFSIDGEAEGHNHSRQTAGGQPTHHLAIKNWGRYREMIASVPDPPVCDLNSVVTETNRLPSIVEYWKKLGVQNFKAVPAEPAMGADPSGQELFQVRRQQYLEDIARLTENECVRPPGGTLTNAYVPSGIRAYWETLSKPTIFHPCGSGYSAVGVDAAGNLYPCQLFIGHEKYILGTVADGPDPGKVTAFREQRARASAQCAACWARFLCHDGCCATDPESGVTVNAHGECEFIRAVAEIAMRTYQAFSSASRKAPDAEAVKL